MRGRRKGKNRPGPKAAQQTSTGTPPPVRVIDPLADGPVDLQSPEGDDAPRGGGREEGGSVAPVEESVPASATGEHSGAASHKDVVVAAASGSSVAELSVDVVEVVASTESATDDPLSDSRHDSSDGAGSEVIAGEDARASGEVETDVETVEEGVSEVDSDQPEGGASYPEEEPSGPTPDARAASAAVAGQAQTGSLNPLPRVLAVANQKGGVGKTTTSVNLGAALAELGYRVLVVDLDPQGNATTGLGIDARNFELSMYDVLMRDSTMEDCIEPTSMKNLFVAPATIALAGAEIELVPAFSRELKLKRAIETVIDDFDYVLIDCPPSLGLITVNALAAATEVLVPIQCEYYALEGLSQLMRNVHLVASNLNPVLDISTIVLTMYDARTKLADQVAAEVREHFGPKVCRIVIPRTVRLSEAPSFGQPITAFDPSSRGAIAYRELAKEVSGGAS